MMHEDSDEAWDILMLSEVIEDNQNSLFTNSEVAYESLKLAELENTETIENVDGNGAVSGDDSKGGNASFSHRMEIVEDGPNLVECGPDIADGNSVQRTVARCGITTFTATSRPTDS